MDWQIEAKRLIRTELVRKDVSYGVLVGLLRGIGVSETERSIQSKIARGSFSFVFFMQVMKAIGTKNVNLDQ